MKRYGRSEYDALQHFEEEEVEMSDYGLIPGLGYHAEERANAGSRNALVCVVLAALVFLVGVVGAALHWWK